MIICDSREQKFQSTPSYEGEQEAEEKAKREAEEFQSTPSYEGELLDIFNYGLE